MKPSFLTLFRLSLSRLIDMEIVSAAGNLQGLLARSLGVLIALSIMLALLIVRPYYAGAIRPSYLETQLRNDEEFLLSLTIAAAGLFSVLVWNSVLPDRSDCLILGTLPVRRRAIAGTRLLALLACLAALTFTVNVFVGISLPFVRTNSAPDALQSFGAWWITLAAASIFPFLVSVALQGFLAQILPWNSFLRVSGWLQLGTLCVVLVMFFLTPAFIATMAAQPQRAAYLPSYWFVGLVHALNGDRLPLFRSLAFLAVRNLLIVSAIAALVFTYTWAAGFRKIIEAPDIMQRRSGRFLFADNLLRRPLDRAVVSFTLRTILRSRQHRLLLAIYWGLGFSVAAVFAKSLIGGRNPVRWGEPNSALLTIGILVTVSIVVGIRAIFVLPFSLDANWAFRITAIESAARYFAATRKSLLCAGVLPAWALCTIAYLLIWPVAIACQSSTLLLLTGLILAEYRLHQFRIFPFACSWLPADGQSVSTVRSLAFFLFGIFAASAFGGIELWAMRSPTRFGILLAVISAWWIFLYRRNQEFSTSASNTLQFEHLPPPEILALDLRPDGIWSST